MFGHPSLAPALPVPTAPQASPMKMDEVVDEDAMDWTPTNPSPVRVKKADDDGAWLRPQQFFPPERPTGLESLFANTKLDDAATASTVLGQGGWNGKAIAWMATMTVVFVPLATVVYHWWIRGWIQ